MDEYECSQKRLLGEGTTDEESVDEQNGDLADLEYYRSSNEPAADAQPAFPSDEDLLFDVNSQRFSDGDDPVIFSQGTLDALAAYVILLCTYTLSGDVLVLVFALKR